MIRLHQIFVSSTSDLERERQSIEAFLRDAELTRTFSPYLYEQDTKAAGAPRDVLLQEIARSELFLLILGGRYGSPYPDAEQSIVEWELETARKNRLLRPGLRILSCIKAIPEHEIEPEQKRFRDRVGEFVTGLWCTEFDSIGKLEKWLRGRLFGWLQSRVEMQRRAMLFSVVHVAIILGLSFALLQWSSSITATSLVAAGTLLAVAGIGGLLIILRHGVS